MTRKLTHTTRVVINDATGLALDKIARAHFHNQRQTALRFAIWSTWSRLTTGPIDVPLDRVDHQAGATRWMIRTDDDDNTRFEEIAEILAAENFSQVVRYAAQTVAIEVDDPEEALGLG